MSRRASTASTAGTAAATLGAIAGLSSPAWACPFCSLTQSADTLIYVAALMLVPYLIVSGVVLWVRRVLASEKE